MNNFILGVQKMSDSGFFWLELFLFINGIFFIISFFYYLNLLRILRTTPTSKIRSAAQGSVELKGNLSHIENNFIAPFSKKSCCWYKFFVEFHSGSYKKQFDFASILHNYTLCGLELEDQNSRSREKQINWYPLLRGKSLNTFAVLNDDEGGASLLNLHDAKIEPHHIETWIVGKPILEKVDDIMVIKGFEKPSHFHKYRITEHRIHKEQEVFALGFFRTLKANENPYKLEGTEEYIRIKRSEDSAEYLAKSIDSKNVESGKFELAKINKIKKINEYEWNKYVKENNLDRVNYLGLNEDDPCMLSANSIKQDIKIYRNRVLFNLIGSIIVWSIITAISVARIL